VHRARKGQERQVVSQLSIFGTDTRKLLQQKEEQEKPFVVKKRLVVVDLRSVARTAVPDGYQVLWSETTIDPG